MGARAPGESVTLAHETRSIAILGSTGSIGTSALDLIARLNMMEGDHPRFRVVALAARRRVETLAAQVRAFAPEIAAIGDEESAAALRAAIGATPTRVVSGPAGLEEAATAAGAELVLAAIVGAAGLAPTWAAVRAGRTIALANKETLVMAGDLMLSAARAGGAVLLPVDSEHNALHQCLRGETAAEVQRLVLTASGGPFFRQRDVDLATVTPQEALKHPTWEMGPKISIDSATLMNKALEVIEAHYLFGLPAERISVVIHPQSIIHSMVEFVDGSFVCQLGATDMRHPIQYALTWPRRVPTPLPRVSPAGMPELTFCEPDMQRFPCLRLGWEALARGGGAPAALNAANEIAVEEFLAGRLRFTEIATVNETVMRAHPARAVRTLDDVMQSDAWARSEARALARQLQGSGASHPAGSPSAEQAGSPPADHAGSPPADRAGRPR